MFDIRKFRSGKDILIPAGIHHVTEPIVLTEKNLRIRGEEALLEEGLVAGEESQYGLTIITVDGEAAVWDTDNAYWAIWIGDEMAMTGASEIPVYDGSSFKLEYTSLG